MIERVVWSGGAPLVRVTTGRTPVIAIALHAGHELRPDLESHLALSPAERLREEDPGTALMAPQGVTTIEVLRSRFEVDLNRPRFRAVYQGAGDAWGLKLYRHELPNESDRVSRAVYDTFYATAFDVLSVAEREHGRFVVLDIHSYNHRRAGADAPASDPADNPGVNVGTRRLDRVRWAGVVDGFITHMREEGFDCRENVKFGGGHFAHWVAEMFPRTGAVLALEFKKTYMDEWTGRIDATAVEGISAALDSSLDTLEAALASVE